MTGSHEDCLRAGGAHISRLVTFTLQAQALRKHPLQLRQGHAPRKPPGKQMAVPQLWTQRDSPPGNLRAECITDMECQCFNDRDR